MRRARPKVLALVLAGGEGGRLEVLTAERAKPALPFAGVYRLVDFPLSNCHHSGIGDVWVLQQYEPHSLAAHLSGGRPWDLDRTYGGLRTFHPYVGDDESGWYRGNADALHRTGEEIAAFDADVLLVLSADHVYRLDYRDVLEEHLDSGMAVTVVTTRVDRSEAGEYGVVDADGERVTGFEYKPDGASDGPRHDRGLRLRPAVPARDARRDRRGGGRGGALGLRRRAPPSPRRSRRGPRTRPRRLLEGRRPSVTLLAGAHGSPRRGPAA